MWERRGQRDLRRGAVLGMRGPGLETGLGGGEVCGGEGGHRATAAQLQCHPTLPTWPPALPPAQPAGPRAGTTREKRKLFFFPFAKTFSRCCHPHATALPAHFPRISFLRTVLEDELGG